MISQAKESARCPCEVHICVAPSASKLKEALVRIQLELKITPKNWKLDVGTDFPICSVKLPVSSFEAAASQESTLVMQSQFRIILCLPLLVGKLFTGFAALNPRKRHLCPGC